MRTEALGYDISKRGKIYRPVVDPVGPFLGQHLADDFAVLVLGDFHDLSGRCYSSSRDYRLRPS